ncbi:Glycosyl transferase family 2 [Riemerella columbipharyngis]|uniref:Glycosyl transferase family 2 n=2 Tax=Riemerella columbipharyngis TaxID=1071918 RepID=A0A1G7EBI0_9FLAO|nr:Glycosyl transferase family 2 [Riemerella columbipharyngis]
MSVYNAEKYLSQAVESIVRQVFEDFEFIIIDDCSTDKSYEIIRHYVDVDKRIKVLRKQENKGSKGFVENLNWGLKEAKGQYVARMDADDISHPERLEKQVQFLDAYSDVFMVGSSINFIDEKDNFIKVLEAPERDEAIKQKMPKSISMYHPVIMFRNNAEVRYRDKIYYCEDYDLYLRLMIEGKKFYNFTTPLLDYRILETSISRKDGKFFRTLFVEKTKQFYRESLKYGKDSYEEFHPEYLLHILDSEKNESEKELKFALNVATKHRYKKELSILMNQYKSQYGNKIDVILLNIMNSFPMVIPKFYYKFLKKSF